MRAPGVVYFFSSRSPPPNFIDSSAPPPIELLDVIDFKVESSTLLQLITSDSQVVLRFKSGVECDTWRRGLIEWKDFSVDHGCEYMARNARRDVENGAGTSSSTSSSAAAASRFPSTAPTAISLLESGTSRLGDERPAPLECCIDLKTSSGSVFAGEWQKRYMRVEERSASLVVAKSSGSSEKALLIVHLPEVADIYTSAEFGASYFDVQLDGVTHKFRAANDAEGHRLVAALNNWKEYLLLNMSSS